MNRLRGKIFCGANAFRALKTHLLGLPSIPEQSSYNVTEFVFRDVLFLHRAILQTNSMVTADPHLFELLTQLEEEFRTSTGVGANTEPLHISIEVLT